jgi:hypothetical protein
MHNTIKHIQRHNDRATRNAQKRAMAAIFQTFEECQKIFDNAAQRVSRSEIVEACEDAPEFAGGQDYAGMWADR